MVPVQFITHRTARYDYEQGALLALRGGCKWVQLRMKEATDEDVRPVARRLLSACRSEGAVLVLDDRVELARELELDGVHLGQHDMPVDAAREKLGQGFIIGGTANTAADVLRLWQQGVDYVGLGPMRFTETKKGLSPVIGLEGYRQIMQELSGHQGARPVCAIGGITISDVGPLLGAGVSGVAVSGCVLSADDPAEYMRKMINSL